MPPLDELKTDHVLIPIRIVAEAVVATAVQYVVVWIFLHSAGLWKTPRLTVPPSMFATQKLIMHEVTARPITVS